MEVAYEDIVEIEKDEPNVVPLSDDEHPVNVDDDGYYTPDEHTIARLDSCKPFVGKEFASDDEAYVAYNNYSMLAGFNIKRNQSRKSHVTGNILWSRLCCSKEGFHRPTQSISEGSERKRAKYTTRTGCNAMMEITRQCEEEKIRWVVSQFDDEHNHCLVSPEKVHFMRSHRHMDSTSRKFILDCNKVGIRPGRAFDYMVEKNGSHSHVGFLKKDVQNVIRDSKKNFAVVDAQSMCHYLERKQLFDTSFFYSLAVNEKSQISSVFWADGRSKNDFKVFGDVLCFDTTYKTNRYRMPFAPFVGMNHHGQSVLFGAALLSDETIDSFVWLFERFATAMGNVSPKTIITDQDAAIGAAVARVFPHARHRHCLWHIMQKFPEKFAHLYNSRPDFKDDVFVCLRKQDTIEEFEQSWHSFLTRYNLQDNPWLQSLYAIRHKWIPVYMNDTFFGGMSTNQRSETMHAFLDFYMGPFTALTDFVEQFDRALKSRRIAEAEADYRTKNTIIGLRTASRQLEGNLRDIYTAHNFKIVQEELFESNVYSVSYAGVIRDVVNYSVRNTERNEKIRWVTYIQSTKRASCMCKMFDSKGLVCRHILALLKSLGERELPKCYILQCLTRNPWDGHLGPNSTSEPQLLDTVTSTTLRELDQDWGWLRGEAVASDYACNALRKALKQVMQEIKILRELPEVNCPELHGRFDAMINSAHSASPNVLDPPVVRTKGSCSSSRLKSGKEIAMSKREMKCGLCKGGGHNRRKCPLLQCSLGRHEGGIDELS